MRSDPALLTDVLEAAEAIGKFTAGRSRDSFIVDDLVRSAVLAKLMIIGEAAGNVSTAIRDKYPEVPWVKIRGLRNVVIHAYHEIDWTVVWNAAVINVPELVEHLEGIMRNDFPHADPRDG
jgi:uncharacterized protein with HEPN domain